MAQLLLVEDDAAIRGALIRALTDRGHAVTSMPSAMDALQHVLDSPPDLILLDLGLPGLGGYEALRMMRAVSSVPVVVVTARDNEAEIIRVLDAGADDYVVKPFGAGQIDARIRAVLRRAAPGEPPDGGQLEVGGLRLDPSGHEATLDGAPLDLSRREFDLLHYLALRAGQVVTRRDLLTDVWRHALRRRGQDRRRSRVLAAPQARRDRAAAPLPAHRPRGRDQAQPRRG